jgi:hypothetical protein
LHEHHGTLVLGAYPFALEGDSDHLDCPTHTHDTYVYTRVQVISNIIGYWKDFEQSTIKILGYGTIPINFGDILGLSY